MVACDDILVGAVIAVTAFIGGSLFGSYSSQPIRVYDRVFRGEDYRVVMCRDGESVLMERSEIYYFNGDPFLRFKKNTNDIVDDEQKGIDFIKEEILNNAVKNKEKDRLSLEKQILSDN